MSQPYQPSNGTEGMRFCGKFCDQCIHEKYSHTLNDNDKKCDILTRSMVYGVNDLEYPKDWIYDVDNNPTCTAWVKWDWNQDDDGNWNDPPEPEPVDPNQLMLFSEWDEIEYKEPIIKKAIK
jgi:hypothetical protein